MMALKQGATKGIMPGIGFIMLAWLLFALHDASIKLLVANLSAWHVLFVRSLIVLPACLILRRRSGDPAPVPQHARARLLVNALVYALAWIAYYSAARELQLAELETVYYASPIIATGLAAILLHESVPLSRWSGLAIGFLGVVLRLCSNRSHEPHRSRSRPSRCSSLGLQRCVDPPALCVGANRGPDAGEQLHVFGPLLSQHHGGSSCQVLANSCL